MPATLTPDQKVLFDMAQIWAIHLRGKQSAGDTLSHGVYLLAEVLHGSGFNQLSDDEIEQVEDAVLEFYFEAAA